MRQQQQQEQQQEYLPGTNVFAKLKGYPWWPARIEADHSVPAKVLKRKAKSKGNLYTVFFYGSRDYGFFGPDALKPFDNAVVKNELASNKYKSKDLENAVRQALNPALLAQIIKEEEEEEEEEEDAVETKKKGKAKKTTNTRKQTTTGKKRNSKIALEEKEVNETSIGNNIDGKRRRQSMSIEEEEAQDIKKTPEFKAVYSLRHKLQRLVYNKSEGEIPTADYSKILDVVQEIEKAPMNFQLLKDTKIGKVVKAACSYPFENNTVIRDRCHQLMRNWKTCYIDTQVGIHEDED